MFSDKDKVDVAQWILERNLEWVSSADVKVGVVIAIDTAMLGGLAAVFGAAEVKTNVAVFFAIFAALLEAIAIFSAGMCVVPILKGPDKHLVFFGKIASLKSGVYAEKFKSSSEVDFLDDILAQIHRNAEIALQKHQWVNIAMRWSFLSMPFWVAGVALLAAA